MLDIMHCIRYVLYSSYNGDIWILHHIRHYHTYHFRNSSIHLSLFILNEIWGIFFLLYSSFNAGPLMSQNNIVLHKMVDLGTQCRPVEFYLFKMITSWAGDLRLTGSWLFQPAASNQTHWAACLCALSTDNVMMNGVCRVNHLGCDVLIVAPSWLFFFQIRNELENLTGKSLHVEFCKLI